MDESPLHDGVAREIRLALEAMGAMKDREPAETLYLRMCDEAIRRAAREMADGWK